MRLSKRIICLLLAFCLVAAVGVTSFAKTKSEIQAEINQKNKEAQEIKARIAELEKEEKTVLNRKNIIDAEIDQVNIEINALQAEIDAFTEKITAKEAEIAEKEAEIAKMTEVFHTRIRVMYENKNISYLEVLLTSESFSDFLLKLDLVKQLLSNDKNILDDLNTAKEELNAAKAELEADRQTVESAKALVDEKKAELRAKSNEQQAIINELEAQKKDQKAELKEVEAAENSLREEIKKLDRQANGGAKYTGGAFTWPCPGVYRITDNYGMRVHPVTGVYKMHTGIDIAASYGTNVLAAADGTVIVAGWNAAYGNCIVISHGGGLTTLYGHNSSMSVSRGATVRAGQVIAKVGSTGYSTGPHLHFEVSIDGVSQSPWNYFG